MDNIVEMLGEVATALVMNATMIGIFTYILVVVMS